MILYVLLIWLCAVGCVLLTELAYLSLQQQNHSNGSHSLVQTQNIPEPALPYLTGLALALGAFTLGLILGYLLESRLCPMRKLYLALQKRYPPWYQRWPADKREIFLTLSTVLPFCLLCTALGLGLGFNLSYLGWLSGSLGFAMGLLILPILRYRGMLLDDRPEQPPQAVLHKIVPDYSLNRALKIGQIYLRLLLPVFSLFCILLLPLALEQIVLTPGEAVLLMTGLFLGTALGWYANRDSHLHVENFRRNLYQLSALALLSTAFLFFGLSSENQVQLLLMSSFSGYLAGLY